MRMRSLGTTDIVTSMLGFGCATLFHLPQKASRRRILDAAYAAGIRHYDVAPIYGLGRAEGELGAFLGKRRSEVTVTTKFGIEPTLLGRVAGLGQAPIRALLQHSPHVQAGLQLSARGPHSGSAGHALYREVGFSAKVAEACLTQSLRALKTEHIDIFVLHEPIGQLGGNAELTDYLDAERDRGRIRAWGTAGEDGQVQAQMVNEQLPGLQVIQHRDHLLEGRSLVPDSDQLGRITFGVLAQALPRILSLLSARPELSRDLSEVLGVDLSNSDNMVYLLMRDALRRNTCGPVLFTTTRADRIFGVVSAVETEQTPLERDVLQKLGDALGSSLNRSGGHSDH
jgi:D-threo-aldose 1-dehydrogenase